MDLPLTAALALTRLLHTHLKTSGGAALGQRGERRGRELALLLHRGLLGLQATQLGPLLLDLLELVVDVGVPADGDGEEEEAEVAAQPEGRGWHAQLWKRRGRGGAAAGGYAGEGSGARRRGGEER